MPAATEAPAREVCSEDLAGASRSLVILAGCCTIPLTKGLSALVSESDYPALIKNKWCAYVSFKSKREYRYVRRKKDGASLLMHRDILGVPGDMDVDHRSADGLDNTRENIRVATKTQNMGNRRPRAGKRFKGISKDTRAHSRPWVAHIHDTGRNRWLGSFATPEEAARAYDKAAIAHFGEFARLNFPDQSSAARPLT